MCVTKKPSGNRRPRAFAAAATFLGTSSPPVAPSSRHISSRFASTHPHPPMISFISACSRPTTCSIIHPLPEAEPSTTSANTNATTTTNTPAAANHDRFVTTNHTTSITTGCRKRQRASMVVSPPPSPSHRQKSVTFSTTTVVETVVPSSTMTDERKDEIWYGQNALENFKKAARRDSKAHRRGSLLPLSSSTLPSSGQRGLEHRISLERQRNKYVAQRAILECARRLTSSSSLSSSSSLPNSPTSTIPIDADVHLALVSSKVTRWSREVALSTGRDDFYAAYPEEAAAQNNVSSCCPRGLTLDQINAIYPFPMSFNRVRPAGTMGTTAPVASSSSSTGTAHSAAVVVADLGPIPTKFNASPIQEEDSDDEHRRRLAKRRRRR